MSAAQIARPESQGEKVNRSTNNALTSFLLDSNCNSSSWVTSLSWLVSVLPMKGPRTLRRRTLAGFGSVWAAAWSMPLLMADLSKK